MNAARYRVEIVNPADGRAKVWSTHAERELAEAEATKLRRHKFFVQVRRIDDDQVEKPEHHGDRSAFVIWAVMCGFAPPERLTERVVDEIEREAQQA